MAQSTSDETLSTFYVITTQLHIAACPQLFSLKYWDQSNATFFAWITLPSIISGCHIQNLPVIQCSHTLTDLLTDCYQAYCLTGQLKKKKWQLPCDLSMLSCCRFVFTSDVAFTNSHLHSLYNLALYTQQLHLSWKLRQHTQFIFGAISWVLSHPFCTTVILVILLFVLNKGAFAVCFKKSGNPWSLCDST